MKLRKSRILITEFILCGPALRGLALRGLALCGLALCGLGIANADEPPSRTYAIRVGKVFTLSDEPDERVVYNATILVRDGKITALGASIEIPADMRVVELPNHVILPGLIDAETTLTSVSVDATRSVAPEIRAIDGWDFLDERKTLLEGGVTAVYLAPGVAADGVRSTRLISGRGAIVKTAGFAAQPLRRIVRETGGVQVTLGEISRSQPSIYDPPLGATPDNPFKVIPTALPQSRAGEFQALRKVFRAAQEYSHSLDRYLEGRGELPERNIDLTDLVGLFRGGDHLRVRATKAHDIYRMIELASRADLRLVLEAGAEVERLIPLLVEHDISVVFSGAFRPGRIPTTDLSQETSRGLIDERAFLRLVAAGVRVVLSSPSDAEVQNLLLQASTAVGMGLDPHEALRSITRSPAEITGVDDRIGSIAPGMDADFLVLDGDPFDPSSRPQAVVIDGEVVLQKSVKVDKDVTVIRCGQIHTAAGRDYVGGLILVKGGKIEYVGSGAVFDDLSGAGRVIDARDQVVIPGLIDAGSSIGTHAESLTLRAFADSGSSGGGGGAGFRLADSIQDADPAFSELVEVGITTAVITPDARGTFSGQLSVVKLAAKDAKNAYLNKYAAALFGSVSSSTLKKAKAYHDQWTSYEKKKEEAEKKGDKKALAALKKPTEVEIYHPLLPVFRGEVPVVVAARSRSSAEAVFKLLRETYKMKVIIYGFTSLGDEKDIDASASVLRAAEGLLLDAPFLRGSGDDARNVPLEWSKRNLAFAFRSRASTGGRFLPLQVAYAAREGLSPDAALRAMTIAPARIFGVSDRVGSIEKGKDADLVFLSGEPFSMTTRVRRVMVDGELVIEGKK